MDARIVIVPHREDWPADFLTLAQALRQVLGPPALRIDHIGSTAVPGLAAKDIIDIQVTVDALAPAVDEGLRRAGYERTKAVTADHVPPGATGRPDDWAKWLFKSTPPRRPVNVHVRLRGRANQRYALLFRDYLRAQPAMAEAYAQIKIALARQRPDDFEAYYVVKDPACDLILGGAEAWAAATGWTPGKTDC